LGSFLRKRRKTWLAEKYGAEVAPSRLKRPVEFLLSFGAYQGESGTQRGKRRIMVGAIWLASLGTLPYILVDLEAGQTWVAAGSILAFASGLVGLVAMRLWPDRFALIVNAIFVVVYLTQLSETALLGGLLPSGLAVVFGLQIVLGALVALSLKAASWWFGAFIASIAFSVVIPTWIDPLYVSTTVAGDAAFNLAATSALSFAVMAYFVRQRDRFQKQSDDLLHNILPDEIANKLKTANTMIADSFESASVLFADVVGFTPMSATMSPVDLVGLLNDLFTTFDRFVDELGMEKIKTVGDAYMVASGVPRTRSDHAEAIAELALRIRDHVAVNRFDGHELSMRIGINSGPVVAGIIGTHKFAYDLWGDAVNTASRMESGSVPGSIQVSVATYLLIRDKFVCEPRGSVAVKGKGEMDTYFLMSRRAEAPAIG
jgi:adenylate cyclase